MSGFFLDTAEISKISVAKPVGSGRLVSGCTMCKLKQACNSPRMDPYGNGGKGIVIVGEAPGRDDDRLGRPFAGTSGRMQRECLERAGIDMDMDCLMTNVVQCHPEGNKFPGKEVVENCSLRLNRQLLDLKPKLIIASGFPAIQAVLKPPFSCTVNKMHGRIVPSQKYNCWVACVYHPSFVLRMEQDDIRNVYVRDLKAAVKKIGLPLLSPLDKNAYELIDNVDEAIAFLHKMATSKFPVAFDWETTCLDPFSEKAKILSVGFSTDPSIGHCIPIGYNGCWTRDELARINKAVVEFLVSDVTKVVQNAAFERLWSQVIYGVKVGGYVWDTMNCAHVENETPGTCGLDFQVFTRFGDVFKEMVDKSKLEQEPLQNLAQYNCLDSRYEMWIYLQQLTLDKQLTAACHLMNINASCLTDMKQRGMKVDFGVIETISAGLSAKIDKCEADLSGLDVVKKYNVTEEKRFNFGSTYDVAKILYNYLEAPFVDNVTAKGNVSVGEDTIKEIVKKTDSDRNINAPVIKIICELVLALRKLTKQRSTYVDKLAKIADKNGIIHPSYMLHTTVTYRSSSRDPNFQNFPKRDPEQKKIRRAFVPHIGDMFIEFDFQGSEICMMAMLSGDKLLQQQLNDDVDVHRRWASELFERPEEEITKLHRYIAKNGFVFPEFYGSWHVPIAAATNLKVDRVKEVEELFWKTHPGIKDYQNSEYALYNKNGYIQYPLGFRRHAPMTKNEIINSKIQGTAFLLLLVGCQDAENEMRKMGLRSSIVNEIHDSVLIDTCGEEIEEVVSVVERCLTKQHFDWMEGVRMKVSMAIGENWYEMEDI